MYPLNAVQRPTITVMIAAPVGLLPYEDWVYGLGADGGVDISAIIIPIFSDDKHTVKPSEKRAENSARLIEGAMLERVCTVHNSTALQLLREENDMSFNPFRSNSKGRRITPYTMYLSLIGLLSTQEQSTINELF